MSYTNHQIFEHKSTVPVRRACEEGHQFTSAVHTMDQTVRGDSGIKTEVHIFCAAHCPACHRPAKRYSASELTAEANEHEYWHEGSVRVDGMLRGRSGWHFPTKDEDLYGPYATKEECIAAAKEYAKQL